MMNDDDIMNIAFGAQEMKTEMSIYILLFRFPQNFNWHERRIFVYAQCTLHRNGIGWMYDVNTYAAMRPLANMLNTDAAMQYYER